MRGSTVNSIEYEDTIKRLERKIQNQRRMMKHNEEYIEMLEDALRNVRQIAYRLAEDVDTVGAARGIFKALELKNG